MKNEFFTQKIYMKSVEENSSLWQIAERTALADRCKVEGKELQAVLSQAGEDHLGVALIRLGGSRYEQMKWQSFIFCNKGGTAYFTSLAIYDCKGLSFCTGRKEKS